MTNTNECTALLEKRKRVRELLEQANPEQIKNLCLVIECLSKSQVLAGVLEEVSASSR